MCDEQWKIAKGAMLCLSVFSALFIEKPFYHCVFPLIFTNKITVSYCNACIVSFQDCDTGYCITYSMGLVYIEIKNYQGILGSFPISVIRSLGTKSWKLLPTF